MANPNGDDRPDYWFMNTGDEGTKLNRTWEDCKRYGFVVAGGGPKYIDAVRSLRVGDCVFAYLSQCGYVGLGRITAEAVPRAEYIPAGHSQPLRELPHSANISQNPDAPDSWEWCASIRWLYALDALEAVCKDSFRRPTLQPVWDKQLPLDLIDAFEKAIRS